MYPHLCCSSTICKGNVLSLIIFREMSEEGCKLHMFNTVVFPAICIWSWTHSHVERYRDPGPGPGLGSPSRISAFPKFPLSKLRTHVILYLLYSSARNCPKTIHSRTTTSTPLLTTPKSTKIQIYIGNCPISTVKVVVL